MALPSHENNKANGDLDLEKQQQQSPCSKQQQEQQQEQQEQQQEQQQQAHEQAQALAQQRSPWLRALVLGANDGLVSIASLLLGVSAGNYSMRNVALSGIAGLVAGACSMGLGEYVSVSSQRDTEMADVERERLQHQDGPDAAERELEELAQIYAARGLSYELAKKVAEELSREGQDVIKVHARDELGIDVDSLSKPWQAAGISVAAFSSGGAIPLLAAAFVEHKKMRLVAVAVSTSIGLAAFGGLGAKLGGAPIGRASTRVTVGGWMAMLITYGILYLVSRTSDDPDIL